jgi:hypothetical protein
MSKKQQQAKKPVVESKPSSLPGSVEELDILDVTPMGALDLITSFQQAERKLISYIARHHETRIETIFEKREHYNIPAVAKPVRVPAPVIPNDATEEQTDDDLNWQYKKAKQEVDLDYEERCRARSKAVGKYDLSKPKVYQTIWGQLTLALQEELKSDATSYEQYDKSRDSLSLWIAVRYFCINGTQD